MAALERRGSVASEQASLLSMHCGCPEISSIITKLETLENGDCSMPEVSIRSSVRDAARIMKQTHSTAVLVLNHSTHGSEFDKLGGIFTTKDVVLRVIAAGLDPAITSVIRVMTPHPDSVPSNTSILVALKKLYGSII